MKKTKSNLCYNRLADFFQRWGNKREQISREREALPNPGLDELISNWNKKEITNPHSYIA